MGLIKEQKLMNLNFDGLCKDGDVIYSNGPKIVSFADGTDEEIAAMLDAHYAGKIDISNYWNIGDKRQIHLNATTSDDGTSCYVNHAARDVYFYIIGFNHDTLTTPINNITKAAVTLRIESGLNEADQFRGTSNLYGTGFYSTSIVRKFLNNKFYNCLPSTFNILIKQVTKKHIRDHYSDLETVKDKCWILSYTERFGNKVNSHFINGKTPNNNEGAQYKYFVDGGTEVKNNNVWSRSASSDYPSSGEQWDCTLVFSGSTVSTSSKSRTDTHRIAPAFCL